MSSELWAAVDRYAEDSLLAADPVLDATLTASDAAGLPAIAVSALQGKFLHLLAVAMRATRILEIGTLGGYSTIWLARALPTGGRLVTLELSPDHARVARDNLATAGLGHQVEVRVGPALDSLPALEKEGAGPFDFVFIDANKADNAAYVDWAVRLGRPGTMIVVDNVVRGGAVADPASTDPAVVGVHRLHRTIAATPSLDATVLQTVGVKGHDGFVLALVTG